MQVPDSSINIYSSVSTWEFSHVAFLGSNLCVF